MIGVKVTEIIGSSDQMISSIAFDSRKVTKNTLFVAIRGTQVDGHNYINPSIETGSTVIVAELLPEQLQDGVSYILVEDSMDALGKIASNFYNTPSSKLTLIGVTGTNGKTTCVTLLHQLFTSLNFKCGLLSTVENKIGDDVVPSTHTTPDPIQLNQLLNNMVDEGCLYAFMEVSSHSIHQKRISGLQFKGGVFTNISHDHLDYHKTFDEYLGVKKKFFDDLPKTAFALINMDDKRGRVMFQNTLAKKVGYALKTNTDYHAKVVENSIHGLELKIKNNGVWFKLVGEFNAYNLLAVYAVADLLGINEYDVLTGLSNLKGAKGRFETIISKTGIAGIIDYAHTPDALDNVLETIIDVKKSSQKIITVVGCGGDRDVEKRPVMAKIASHKSDRLILTSDNPRSEEPRTIIKQMEEGLESIDLKKVTSIEDRREAIKLACSFAAPDDIVLIAGKGHEDYQEIKGVKHHFDDKEVLIEMFQLLDI